MAELPARRVWLGEDDGRTALLVDGVVQSISPDASASRGGYWSAMVPAFRPRGALILGLGGGTVAHALVRRWGTGIRIVGVDADRDVLDTAREAGWLSLPGLDVVVADALAYVLESARIGAEPFDFVALDLYRADTFVGRMLHRDALEGLRALMAPPALLAANFFLDRHLERRLARLGRTFGVEQQVRVGTNVVVHARPRRPATRRRAPRRPEPPPSGPPPDTG